MNKATLVGIAFCLALLFAAGHADAQKKKTSEKKGKKAKVTVVAEKAATEATPAIVLENTLEACEDKQDNDRDGHVDCEDQDCEIFAMCVKGPAPVLIAPMPPPPPMYVAPPPPRTETGRLCSDGLDNNNDGLIDCFEKSCQRYRYCRKQIYYVPEPEDKAPGLFITFGGGIAFPNFRGADSTAWSNRYSTNIEFEPDIGFLVDLQVGYLPINWIGFGLNYTGGVTGATNENDGNRDTTLILRYKYQAMKSFNHIGGFVRFQYPFSRVVPYINVAAGYTYVYQQWRVYNGDEDWDDIYTNDEDDLHYTRETLTSDDKHFTVALEPGIDVFLRKRSIAVGLRAWLPIFGTSDAANDNLGVIFNVTFTPMWREKPQIRPEYMDPVSTLDEEEPEFELTPADEMPTPADEMVTPATGGAIVAAESEFESKPEPEPVAETKPEPTPADEPAAPTAKPIEPTEDPY